MKKKNLYSWWFSSHKRYITLILKHLYKRYNFELYSLEEVLNMKENANKYKYMNQTDKWYYQWKLGVGEINNYLKLDKYDNRIAYLII